MDWRQRSQVWGPYLTFPARTQWDFSNKEASLWCHPGCFELAGQECILMLELPKSWPNFKLWMTYTSTSQEKSTQCWTLRTSGLVAVFSAKGWGCWEWGLARSQPKKTATILRALAAFQGCKIAVAPVPILAVCCPDPLMLDSTFGGSYGVRIPDLPMLLKTTWVRTTSKQVKDAGGLKSLSSNRPHQQMGGEAKPAERSGFDWLLRCRTTCLWTTTCCWAVETVH